MDAQERAHQVGVDHLAELGRVALQDRDHPGDRRVVDQDVQAAASIGSGSVHRSGPLLGVGHVQLDEPGPGLSRSGSPVVGTRLSAAVTCAPAATMRRTISAPSPRAAPVTSATLPSKPFDTVAIRGTGYAVMRSRPV